MADLTKNTYTIQSIATDGVVSVVFDVDGKLQKLGGVPVENSDETKLYLSNYLIAYKEGLQKEILTKTIAPTTTALVGKLQTAKTKEELVALQSVDVVKEG